MDNERYRRISDGFAIYLPNKQSRTWWVRVRISKKEIKKSTENRDIEKALEMAYLIKAQLQNRVLRKLPVTSSKTINAISEPFLEYVNQTQAVTTTRHLKRYFNRYLKTDWGNRSVDEINANDILKLYDKHELHGTKIGKYTEILLKRLFDFLEFNDYITKDIRPTIPKPKAKITENFALLKVDELKAFENKFKELAETHTNIYLNNKTTKNKNSYIRYMLAELYFSSLINVGCRPNSELLGIKFKHVIETNKQFGGGQFRFDQVNIKIDCGKMSKRSGPRTIPAPRYFTMQLDFICRELYDLNYREMIKKYPDKYIFSRPDKETTINNFEDIFKDVRDGLIKDNIVRANEKIVQYSFRHTYITFALVQKIDIYLLSLAVGSNASTLQKTYSRLAASQRSEEIYKIDIYDSLKEKA